jgi:recombination protein RecA
LLVVNQYTHSFVTKGDPRVTSGGRKKDYAYSTRVEVARDEWITASKGKSERPIGQTVRVKTIKNKTAPQRQLAFYDMYFDHGGPVEPMGIDYAKELVLLGTTFGIIQKRGSWFSYKGQQWQGATNAADGIRQDGDLVEPLEQEVLQITTRGGAVLEIEEDDE